MKPTSEHSFPDAEVVSWLLTPERLAIEMSDVFYDGKLRGRASLVFPLMRPATAMSYDHESNKWAEAGQVEPLKDLCEFHHKIEKRYSLKGFGSVSGKWLAVSVISSDAEITWEQTQAEQGVAPNA